MSDLIMKEIETALELREVLDLCYQYITLGSQEDSFYEKCGYNAIFQIEGQNVYQKKIATQ